jgi:hypothetical protein
MKKSSLEKKIRLVESVGFATVVIFIWIDEVLDLPHHIFGAAATPVNWSESVIETLVVVALGYVILQLTGRILKRMKYLEGLLPICSFCKKVRVGTEWVPVEKYVEERSDADFSHGCCPECAEKHYGRVLAEKRMALLQRSGEP